MQLVPTFVTLLQGLSGTMTAPTLDSFTTLLTGWVFAPRRNVTSMIRAVGSRAVKHFSSYHRVFSTARWSLDAVGLALFELLQPWLGEVVFLALDDTLARKRGLKMFGAGMHHDPLASSRNKAITSWGHSWVVLGVIVEFPFRKGHYYCLPILFRLYLNKKLRAGSCLLGSLSCRFCSGCTSIRSARPSTVGGIVRGRSWPSNCWNCCASTGNSGVFTQSRTVPTAGRACCATCRRTAT